MQTERPYTLPERAKAGDVVSAAEFRKVRDALDRIIRTIGRKSKFVPYGPVATPLQIIPGSTNEKWRIEPGTVNDVTPTMGGTAIDDAEPPEIEVTADTYVWLKTVGTFGGPDSYVVTVETSSTPDTPAGTDITTSGFVSFFYIGSIIFDNDLDAYVETNQFTGGNLGVESYGLFNEWYRV